MKKKLPTSFDELIKNHYGGSGQIDLSNAAKVEELLASYYGKSIVRKDMNMPPAFVLSLSSDDGETLTQHRTEKQFEEYVVQYSITDEEFEEYVVERVPLSAQSSVGLWAEVVPVEEVSASQECQVDVLQPLKEASIPDARVATNTSPSNAPHLSINVDKPQSQAFVTQSLTSHHETSRAEATEDDFIADLQSILTGQKVFDPASKKTIEKDKLGQPQSLTHQNEENNLPVPEAKNSQAIFDRIAQSMQHANAYDLGTVELENRFADFDKIHEIEQKSAAEKKAKNHQDPVEQSSPATVGSADFIQDLDAIRNRQSTIKASSEVGASPKITPLSSSTSIDKWDRIAQELFGYANYDDYLAQELKSTSFFGQGLQNLHSELIQKLKIVEADLTSSQGTDYKAPSVNSTLRKKAGMHGWGMAIDFKVLENPYVLNEAGEGQLDQELLRAYDHITDFVLGKAQSDLRKLNKGRSAFGDGSIGAVYDSLREESDAMKRYFAWMDDESGLRSFIEQEWSLKHAGQSPPDISQIKAQMKDDYEVLGGATDAGNKRPTGGKGDRPFAPTSGGGKGDPKAGFLNLDKEFILAMTNAGLAWGAINFGGASGDVQHFDIRLDGIGAKVYKLLWQYK
jgi:hypothetical protein